jgi:hypothetical protein
LAAPGSRRELHVRSGSVDGAGPGPTAGAVRRRRLRAAAGSPRGHDRCPALFESSEAPPASRTPSERVRRSPRGSHRSRSIARPSHRAASHLLTTVAPRFVTKSVHTPANGGQTRINRFWSASMARMSGALRFLGGPSGSQMELIAAQCCSRWSGWIRPTQVDMLDQLGPTCWPHFGPTILSSKQLRSRAESRRQRRIKICSE